MSIDWLFDLERDIENGKDIFACPGPGKNQWVFSRSVEDLRKVAKRTCDTTKLPVDIVKVISRNDALPGDLFLVPVNIGDMGARGEPQIQWRPVESKESAEMLKDVRHGSPPVFAVQTQETIQPAVAAS